MIFFFLISQRVDGALAIHMWFILPFNAMFGWGEKLESTDAATRSPYRNPTWPDAVGDAAATSEFLFFIFHFWIRSDLALTRAKPGRFAPIRAESDCIGRISVYFSRKKEIGQ